MAPASTPGPYSIHFEFLNPEIFEYRNHDIRCSNQLPCSGSCYVADASNSLAQFDLTWGVQYCITLLRSKQLGARLCACACLVHQPTSGCASIATRSELDRITTWSLEWSLMAGLLAKGIRCVSCQDLVAIHTVSLLRPNQTQQQYDHAVFCQVFIPVLYNGNDCLSLYNSYELQPRFRNPGC